MSMDDQQTHEALLSVHEALARMQEAVRSGQLHEAREVGSSCTIPLALSPRTDLQVGPELSSGAEAVVLRASWQGQDVALKRFRISQSDDLVRFRRQLAINASLRHPNIMPILGACALPPEYAMVMPLAASSVAARLHEAGWRPSWSQLLTLAADAAAALGAVHAAGYVHRDVKPANWLLAHDGRLLLSDFGLAASLADAASEVVATSASVRARGKPTGGFHRRALAGTLQYMAPELLLRAAPASGASDVYALAVSVNELATGVVPFSDCTKDNPEVHTVLEHGYGQQELAAAVAAAGLRPLLPGAHSAAPPGYGNLMQRCWEAEPAARPSAAEVEAALRGLAAAAAAVEQQQQQQRQGSGNALSWVPQLGGKQGSVMPAVDVYIGSDNLSESDRSTESCMDMDLDSLAGASPCGMSPGGLSPGCASPPCGFHALLAAADCPLLGAPPGGARSAADSSAMSCCSPAASDLEPLAAEVARVHCGAGGCDALAAVGAAGGAAPAAAALRCALGAAASAAPPPPGLAVSTGSFTAVGPRESNEDRHVIISALGGDARVHLAAVFDGHRGAEASAFAAAQLPRALQLAAARRCSAAGAAQPDSCACVGGALADAFTDVDAAFWEEWQVDALARAARASTTPRFPGCTALAVLVTGGRLWVANAGDGRAVLSRRGVAHALSREHTAAIEDERARAVAGGLPCRVASGSWRVGAAALQVTRALGDFDLKMESAAAQHLRQQQRVLPPVASVAAVEGAYPGGARSAGGAARLGVSPVPEVLPVDLTAGDEFVVLGSDGLWDVMSDQEAVGLVADTVKDPGMCAQRLVMEALTRGSADNVTAVVLLLQQRVSGTLERVWSSQSMSGGGAAAAVPAATPTFYGSRRTAGGAAAAAARMVAASDELQDTY